MEKKDFYIPFKWEDRRSVIINRLLYIPKSYDNHAALKEKIYFENDNDVYIEYCSGNGEWIINEAQRNPQINYIAVEYQFLRARKIWVKMHNKNLKNLFIVLGEAFTFTKFYLEKETVSAVFINFPDPWPKERHKNNRLIKSDFILQLARVMKLKKSITLVTDDENYLSQIIEVFLKSENFTPQYKKPYFVQDIKDFGASFFDSLFRKKGKNINYLKFIKKSG